MTTATSHRESGFVTEISEYLVLYRTLNARLIYTTCMSYMLNRTRQISELFDYHLCQLSNKKF